MKQTDNDKDDLFIDTQAQLVDNACQMVASAKSTLTSTNSVVVVDENGDDVAIPIYDSKIHVWKSSDTLDKLAESLLGSASYAWLIAFYNSIQDESTIESGTKIKIPILSKETTENNKIFSAPAKYENYGIDILINDNGDFDFSNNDVATIDGQDNLIQALINRLSTASTKRIRLGAYGIKSTIGDTLAVESFLFSSIEQTLSEDPRIKSIDDLTFYGNGDTLFVSVSFTDINDNQNDFETSI